MNFGWYNEFQTQFHTLAQKLWFDINWFVDKLKLSLINIGNNEMIICVIFYGATPNVSFFRPNSQNHSRTPKFIENENLYSTCILDFLLNASIFLLFSLANVTYIWHENRHDVPVWALNINHRINNLWRFRKSPLFQHM